MHDDLTTPQLRAKLHKGQLDIERSRGQLRAQKAAFKARIEAKIEAIYDRLYSPHEERFAAEEGKRVDQFRKDTIAMLIGDKLDGFGDDDESTPAVTSDDDTPGVKAFMAAIGRK